MVQLSGRDLPLASEQHHCLRQNPLPTDLIYVAGGVDNKEHLVSHAPTAINILDYGGRAAGPGVNTSANATAIKNAVAAANSAGGGVVVIPGGDYSVGSMGFSSISKVSIQGIGLPRLISDAPGSVEPDRSIFNFTTACTDIAIDGIDFDGNYSAHLVGLPANTNNHCIAIGFPDSQSDTITCERFRITNCRLRNSGWQKAGVDKFGDNIRILAANDVWIENNISENPGRWHFSAGSGARHTVRNNRLYINTTTSSHALGSLDWEYAAKTSRGGDHLFEGNTILGMPKFQVSGAEGQKNIRIIGNYLDAEDVDGNKAAGAPSANRGIAIGGASVVSIIGNTVLNIDSTAGILIDPDGNSIAGITVNDNHVDTASDAIAFSSGVATDIVISGNFARSSAASTSGLNLLNSSVSHVTITGNHFESALSFSARIQSTQTTCTGNRFESAAGSDAQFYCAAGNMFANNSTDDDYRFETVSGATGGLVGINKGGISGSGTALASLEGTDAVVPVFA